MNIPYIDLKSGAQLHGDNESAKQMLHLFMAQLDKSISDILHSYDENDLNDMRDKVHSLCGAACYSSTPKLLQILQSLNAHLSTMLQSSAPTNPQDKKLASDVNDLKSIHQQTVLAFKAL